MTTNQAALRIWVLSLVLALTTSLGSWVAASFDTVAKSEESNVELTELSEVEVDSEEEKIAVRRERRIRRPAISFLRFKIDRGGRSLFAKSPLQNCSDRSRHNGCGSHLRL